MKTQFTLGGRVKGFSGVGYLYPSCLVVDSIRTLGVETTGFLVVGFGVTFGVVTTGLRVVLFGGTVTCGVVLTGFGVVVFGVTTTFGVVTTTLGGKVKGVSGVGYLYPSNFVVPCGVVFGWKIGKGNRK